MRKINEGVETSIEEIKIHLIWSIIHDLLKKKLSDTDENGSWDKVSNYVETVTKQNDDKDNSTAYLYMDGVDGVEDVDNVKQKISDSEYKGYFVFLFRYLLYSEDKKYKQYFSLNKSE